MRPPVFLVIILVINVVTKLAIDFVMNQVFTNRCPAPQLAMLVYTDVVRFEKVVAVRLAR
jgi:hypothetical protein